MSETNQPSQDELREELKGKDMTPSMRAEAKKPKNTWFVRRTGSPNMGQIIAIEEKEAWDMLNNTSQWKRRDFQFIGFSDGTKYQEIAAASIGEASRLLPEINQLEKEVEKYRNIEAKMMLDEIIDMDGDPDDAENEANKKKVLRLRTITNKMEDKLEKLQDEYRNHTSNVVKRAQDAELKVAIANWKKKKVWPGNVNIHTPNASPRERARVLNAMGQGGMM